MLVFAPVEYDTSKGATEQMNYYNLVIGVYNKTLDNFVCLVRYNCHVNKKLATDMRVAFIGRASDRFKISVCGILKDN